MIAPIGSMSVTTGTASALTGTYTGNTGLTSTGAVLSNANLNSQEFGKSFDIPLNSSQDETIVSMTYDMVLKDFFAARKQCFPNWFELPEIKATSTFNSMVISWYIRVPLDQTLPQEEIELWES